jgi:peroxiredoxin 2/4
LFTYLKNKINKKMATSLVGRKAPLFKAAAVINGQEIIEDFSLEQYLGQKEVVLFFYPKNFAFVSSTELHAFQEKLAEFEKRKVAVVAVSVDTEQSHWAWIQIDKTQGGANGITYPMVADTNKTISINFGCLAADYYSKEDGTLEATGEMVAHRALYLIDKDGKVRHQQVNDLSLSRNVEEVLRIVDALQYFETKGEVSTAN